MRNLNRHRSFAVLVSVLVWWSTAAGATPQRGGPEQVDRVTDYLAGEACAFPVRLEVTGSEKVIPLPGDRLNIASPRLTATFTDLTDPSVQYTQRITGPITVRFFENGDANLVFMGTNFLEGFTPELPYLALAVGRLELTLDVAGNFVEAPSGPARITNVCDLIAQ